ncbi:hypothetical protein Tco_0267394 [Tanacetum coccineum]
MAELNKNALFTASTLRVYLVIQLNGVDSARQQTKQAKVNLLKQDERLVNGQGQMKPRRNDADEVYTQSQLDVKNISSLLAVKWVNHLTTVVGGSLLEH